MEWSVLWETWIWLGFAATGFAILFNVPARTLYLIFILGALGGSLKLILLQQDVNIILSSFLGALLVGILSIKASHLKHSPSFIFAIPAVIPMVPGAFMYRMMLGVIRLTGANDHEVFLRLLQETIDNGLKGFFVLSALSLGVSGPMLINRNNTKREIKRIKKNTIK
ncbi:threonine/serine exporter family protein [Marinifilum sp. RC60d5]|uniref:threonine/serine exporter family protein n=1 Tax=Marinifilum sp. RC60d5 TaxID=3458414 RepID=UPI0040373977